MKTNLLMIPYIGKNTKEDLIHKNFIEKIVKSKNIGKIGVNYMFLEWQFVMRKNQHHEKEKLKW